jgi:hypothetical protein
MPHTISQMVQIVQTYVIPVVLAVVFSLVTASVYDYLTPSKIQITKHTTDQIIEIPPNGQLKSSFAFCSPDERVVGGGYVSSSPGVTAKDVQIVIPGDEPNVAIVDETASWLVNGYNNHPSQNVRFGSQVYCAKIVESPFEFELP